MTLRPGLISPTHTYLTNLIAYGLGCGLIGASVMFAATPPTVVQAPPIVMTETVTVPMPLPVIVTAEAMPALPSAAVVVSVGGATYMKLAELSEVPRHGKPKLREHDYVTTSVATIAPADVAPVHRAWLGTQVVVDGSCHATVTGFAVVARLIGDTGYVGEEGIEGWTAANVLRLGAPMLAARLDGCTGELARAASLPSLATPEVIEDKVLVARARKDLFGSADMTRARTAWAAWEAEMQSAPTTLEFGDVATRVVRHPTTGATFVSVHATTGGSCGSPDLSVWGLYRAGADGTLTRLPTQVGDLLTIDGFVDVEGDGQLEVIGRPWLGTERVVSRLDGTVVDRLELPFYGCPC